MMIDRRMRKMALFLLVFIFPALYVEISPDSDFIFQNYFVIQKNLTDQLFSNYNRFTPAVYITKGNHLPNKPIQVNMALSYCRLLSVEETKQSIVLIVELYTSWTDSRLTWNPADHYGFETIAVTRKDTVWMPDVLGYDVISSAEILDEERQTITILSNGTVGLFNTMVLEFICLLEMSNFPFDTQHCDYRLSSFSYSKSEMTVTGFLAVNTSEGQFLQSAGNRAWSIVNITVNNTEYFYNPTQSFYSYPHFVFTLKRSTNYYILQLIIPSFIVTVLCMLGLFWSPVDSDSYMEKLNLGFAAILAMMFVMQTATDSMPKINEIDKLSRFLLDNLGLITIACGIIMILGKTSKKALMKTKSESRWNTIKKFLLRYLHFVLLFIFSILAIANLLLLIA